MALATIQLRVGQELDYQFQPMLRPFMLLNQDQTGAKLHERLRFEPESCKIYPRHPTPIENSEPPPLFICFSLGCPQGD